MKTNPSESTQEYIVVSTHAETEDVITLALTLRDGTVPTYTPGQFITVYFPELNTPEGKAYSISSYPFEKHIAITVKAIGEFSNRLCSLHSGDIILASLPCGFFCTEYEDTSLVLLAGGIGITPFRSIVHSTLEHNPDRIISLFYSARTERGAVFKNEMDNITHKYKNFLGHYFFTRDIKHSADVYGRRIRARDILNLAAPQNTDNTEFLICGSIPFVRDEWLGLKKAGVSEDNMYTEAFF
jgi:ferredoxin-NADP reductase